MITQRSRIPKWPPRRTGLSTLEMVLCLPILLFMMALMVNFGTVSSWKVRCLHTARHAVWASRWPRNQGHAPVPDIWKISPSLGTAGGAAATELDHPAVDQAVVRGPTLYNTQVNADLLDPTVGFRHGTSSLTNDFPMLSNLGEYHLRARTHLLDNKWQHQRLGLHSTRQRRIPVLYVFPQTDASYANAYLEAALAILYASFRPDLFPLDRDDEFIGYSQRFGWGSGAPEFHPDLANCCGLESAGSCCHDNRRVRFCCCNHEVVAELVDGLIDRIQGRVERDDDGNVVRRVPSVAERMAQAFIDLYHRVIRELEDLIEADPPPPAGEIAAMQAEIDDLEARIDTLTQYLTTLEDAES